MPIRETDFYPTDTYMSVDAIFRRYLERFLFEVASGKIKEITVNHTTFEVRAEVLETEA